MTGGRERERERDGERGRMLSLIRRISAGPFSTLRAGKSAVTRRGEGSKKGRQNRTGSRFASESDDDSRLRFDGDEAINSLSRFD